MMSVARGGPPSGSGISTVWLGWPVTVTAIPPKVSPAISLEPWTPSQVASVSARISEAVSCAELPGSSTTSRSDAELLALPLAPLVEATNTSVRRTSQSGVPSVVSNESDRKPPVGGSSPVSEM